MTGENQEAGDQTREGGCACGHLRYRLSGEPVFAGNCHCRLCQQQTGSTSVVNAFYESERIELLEGTLSEHRVATGSGGEQVICRCAQCGTAVWSHYPRLGRLGAGVRVGTLDDAAGITLDAVIYIESKLPWVALPQGIPAFQQGYDFREVLPPERFARLMALAERRKAGEG